jgi:hypothetical protein
MAMLNFIVQTSFDIIGRDGKHERPPVRNRILARSLEQAHDIASAMEMVPGMQVKVMVRMYVHGTGWLYLDPQHLQGVLDDLNAAFGEVIHDVNNFERNRAKKVA